MRAAYASEGARLKIEKAAMQAEMQKEKAAMEADLQLATAKFDAEIEVISCKREADAAVAEAMALEAAEVLGDLKGLDAVSEEDRMERTSEFVKSQKELNSCKSQPAIPVNSPSQACDDANYPTWQSQVRDSSPLHANPVSKPVLFDKPPYREHDYRRHSSRAYSKLNVSAQPYTPQGTPAANANPTTTEPLANLLARRDLVSSSLYQFDDRPENYRAWHSSYTNATRGLGLTATEELDLMTKWLGKESGEHVKRMRSVHVNNPAAALRKAWERLRDCYAAPEILEKSLFKRLDDFPRMSAKDHKKLQELGDLLMELQCAKEDGYLPGLSYLDTARGINPIVERLPYGLQEKWVSTGSRWKEDNGGRFPPFEYFASFVCYEARKRNDPSFALPSSGAAPAKQDRPTFKSYGSRNPISVHKTDVSSANQDADAVKGDNDPGKTCPIHNKSHPLKQCRTFRNKTLFDRRAFLKEKGICFRCIASATHLAKDCKKAVRCAECDSSFHETAMHPGPALKTFRASSASAEIGGEGEEDHASKNIISSSCTEVCGLGQVGRSCSKICLAKLYPKGSPEKAVNAYVILDDQSNRSLARSDFFELFNIKAEPSSYYLKTCSGMVETSGRKANGFQIESLDGKLSISLPPLIECNEIINNRSEIPTPSAALHHPHLRKVAEYIPELDPEAKILLLLGRDVIRVHKVRQQVSGPHNAPFAQCLDLGWVLIGDVCLGNAHKPTVTTFKTNVLENGRPSFLQPCTSFMHVKEKIRQGGESHDSLSRPIVTEKTLGQTIFDRTESDNKPAPSIEDTIFIRIMNKEVYRDEADNWISPLPFREPRQRLPNNREQAVNRFMSLQRTLKRKSEMHDQYVAFMGKIFKNHHAEVAPLLGKDEECWYLPTFGVYHPQKPGQIRVVFDSSAQYCNVSLNDVLLTGPDLNNSLLGVLIRFRKEQVAVMADIQQMFHCFQVREDHRNFLRFLWYRDNDTTKAVIEYRMRVHVFGNSPSPAVAIYGLRRAIREGAQKHGADTVQFVERHFYVDDGLLSVPTDAEAIDLLKRTQASLAESNLRLHKFTSNSQTVMEAFAPEDCAKAVKDFDFSGEAIPTQRSLGLLWEITTDTFTFAVSTANKPFTRRGVLSTVNSVFDPLGLLAPVTIQGRALLRELTADQSDWDAPIPAEKLTKWTAWRDMLQDLKHLHVPRTYTQTSLIKAIHTELCVFSDASTKAIGAVAYLKATQLDGQVDIGFVMGKAKLAPQSEPTIPRLELCAAVLAVEMAELIQDELDIKLNETKFYSDSKVVLGYIYNETKRFYVYVHNRVQRIRQSTKPAQWNYVRTDDNPADHASRSVAASCLGQSTWFTGPTFLRKPPAEKTGEDESFELIEPENDNEIRPQVKTYATQLKENGLTTQRFQHFSTFSSLVRGVALLIHIARSCKQNNVSKCKGWHKCDSPRTPDELSQAEDVVIKATQRAAFPKEFAALQQGKQIPKSSSLQPLSPILQGDLICVGGRLKHALLNAGEKNPTILPKDGHVSLLLARHHHNQVKHQGRHLTEGAVRAAGLWILGGKTLINSVIHKCVTCRKLRGKLQEQRMADLPPERLQTCPPFSYVGLDVFGPWSVVTRRTRGGQADSKRWAIIFSCMSSRAVHIEVIESLSTSSCINALRRFFSIRGPAKQLRSDCGTNFIGACRELGLAIDQRDSSAQRFLSRRGCSWEFNPPHSSHMGGSWERMIGMARRIFDSMLLQENIHLTHEVLCTLMAEVTGIMNSRPLVPVSTDPDSPFILSPSMILTQKAAVSPPLGDFTEKDLYTKQWRQVQALANQFWARWSREYLPTLQKRQKWTESKRNLQEGDVVLMNDNQAARNNWPMARITATFPGKDERVRKVEVKTMDHGCAKTFRRPVTELVLLLPKED